MKKNTKRTFIVLGALILIVILTCGVLGYFFSRDTGATGYEEKLVSVNKEIDKLFSDYSYSINKEYEGDCASSMSDDINNKKNGREAGLQITIEFDSYTEGQDSYDEIVKSLKDQNYNVSKSGSDSGRFSRPYFDAKSEDFELSGDYIDSENNDSAKMDIIISGFDCYKD